MREAADIQGMIDRLAQLSQSAATELEFYQALSAELHHSLDCESVRVWQARPNEPPEVLCQLGADDGEAPNDPEKRARRTTAASLFAGREPQWKADCGNGKGTHCTAAYVPVAVEGRVKVVLETQRPAATKPAVDDARWRHLLEVVAELASAFQLRMEIGEGRRELEWQQRLAAFAALIHGSLSPRQTANTIAHEGRRLLGCDRLTVLLRRGRRYEVAAISGQHEFRRRSNAVRSLEKLAHAALLAGEALSHPGGQGERPPQLVAAIDAYCDESAARQIELVALSTAAPTEDAAALRAASAAPWGALIAENFSAGESQELALRLRLAAGQSALALERAREHASVFLLPLWAGIGRATSSLGRYAWAKVLAALIVGSAAAAALLFIEADFEVAAEGSLQPATRRHVFATADGVIDQLLVGHGSEVKAGAILVTLDSPSLALEMEQVTGEWQTTLKKLDSLRVARILEETAQNSSARINSLAAEEEELRAWLASLERQRELLRQRQQALEVPSPISGTIITWNAAERLAARPVREGQRLMTVADLHGPWTLELELPSRSAGHLLAAQSRSGGELPVAYILATQPDKQLQGTLVRLAGSAETAEDGQAYVPAIVRIDAADLADARPGAVATARIACGRRSLGYVWFHDVIDFVHRKILFRLW